MATKPTTKSITAARCRIQINGKIIGFGTGLQCNVTYSYQPVEVIDNLETEEHAPVGYTVDGSISLVEISKRSSTTMGLRPPRGKDADEHLQNLLLMDDAVIVLMDKGVNKNFRQIQGVRFNSDGFSVNARGIAGVNVGFHAIRELDVSEL